MELTPSGLSEFTKSAYRTQNPNTKHSSHLRFSLEMGVGKKYLLKILMARSWEGNLTQLSPPCKYSNRQKIPHCPRGPPFLSHLLLTSRRGVALWTKETKAFCVQIDFRCRFTHSGPMLLAGSRGQHTQTTETLNHPTKTFRLLVHLRRGRHLQICRCRGTCFL